MTQLSQVITIGSSLIDIFIHSEHFQLVDQADGTVLCQRFGEKLEVDSFKVLTGGGASNTAVGFARLGFDVSVVAELGKDILAGPIISEFRNERVGTQLLITERKEQTGGSVILVDNHGGRTVMVHRGAASQLDAEDIPVAALLDSSWVHLSSIAGRLPALKRVLGTVAQHQLRLSWNPGSAELKLLADDQIELSNLRCQVLILNQEEWESVVSKQAQLRQRVPFIVITNGKNGGRVLSGSEEVTYSSKAVTSVDDTGAGDAFAVGFVAGQLRGQTLETCIAWGINNATSVVQHVGAKPGLLRRQEIEKIAKS